MIWWSEYIADWNGISLLQSLGELVPTTTLTSDASGTWGCGAYWESKWFQLAWSDTVGVSSNIAVKELIPIVMAAAMWGKQWRGQVVNCRCDNMAVVAVIKSRASKESEIMHLLRCVAFIEARWEFTLVATHLAGRENTLADDLSRDRQQSFLQARSGLVMDQSVPSQDLVDMVCNKKPDWLSPTCRAGGSNLTVVRPLPKKGGLGVLPRKIFEKCCLLVHSGTI